MGEFYSAAGWLINQKLFENELFRNSYSLRRLRKLEEFSIKSENFFFFFQIKKKKITMVMMMMIVRMEMMMVTMSTMMMMMSQKIQRKWLRRLNPQKEC